MSVQLRRFGAVVSGAALLILAGCGGGGGSDSSTPPAATTTNVSTTVVDGAIKNAVVCLDKNGNGKCDGDEVQGTTDVAGKVTLAVPNADLGKYPIIAAVGTDAVDADNGPVTVAYTLSAPADRTTLAFYACTLTITDPATGAFTYSDSAGSTASGVASFINGTATGTYHDPAAIPTDSAFTAYRR